MYICHELSPIVNNNNNNNNDNKKLPNRPPPYVTIKTPFFHSSPPYNYKHYLPNLNLLLRANKEIVTPYNYKYTPYQI